MLTATAHNDHRKQQQSEKCYSNTFIDFCHFTIRYDTIEEFNVDFLYFKKGVWQTKVYIFIIKLPSLSNSRQQQNCQALYY